ncbi:MAG: hypothetical protein H8E98_05575 [Bacteroidetes bacterium]|nr:hypothetical protein [Bacteroidota bacterium]
MIKIRLLDPNLHRNETTFRPVWKLKEEFKEIGIEFIWSGDSYDFAFVGQASIIDKKVSLQESIDKGLNFLNNITGDYIIVDGQDSTALIGTIDAFRHVHNNKNCKLFLKNSYLKDFDLYKKPWVNGRVYWGKGNYSVPDIDELKPKMKLTGCNWLNTIPYKFFPYNGKHYDISCMFTYPSPKPVYEHELLQSEYYDKHREELLKTLGNRYNIAKLGTVKRVELNTYYNMMSNSKIITAPLGYGEMAPRDLESALLGGILLKPNMDHILTTPNIYVPGETYISVNYDWSDVLEKIDEVLLKYAYYQEYYVENMRKKITEELDKNKFILYIYNIMKNLDNVQTSSSS